MSELEFLRRQRYKRNRKRLSIIQLVAIILLATMALASFLVYKRIDRTQLIEYTESGNVDYRVQYKENNFFPDEWLEKDQTYISSLINGMSADFKYNINTSSDEMKYNYQYVINATLKIESKDKGTPYYVFEEQLSPQKSGVIKEQKSLQISESVSIDYVKYNSLAKTFIDTYGLESAASCTLVVTLDVATKCTNNGFDDINQINYSTSLNVPLAVDSVNVFRTSSNTEGQVNTLEYAGATNRNTFLVMAYAFAAAAIVLALLRAAFLILTKNDDVTYKEQIRKIVRSYGSFIQKMFGEFDCKDYQIVQIKSFVEMLGIRDTIQSPVLMCENKDETMTRFYIPTATKILYMFEIKVNNYDEIYGIDPDNDPDDDGPDDDGYGPIGGNDSSLANEPEQAPLNKTVPAAVETNVLTEEIADEAVTEEAPIEEIATEEAAEAVAEEAPIEEAATEEVVEPVTVEEPVKAVVAEEVSIEEPISEAIPDVILENLIEQDAASADSGEGEILAYLDEQGNIVKITCSRSFTANLIQADPKVRDYYNKLKNRILSYKGVKARMSWRNESYNKGRIQLFKMKIRGKTIYLYCALDPVKYENSGFSFEVATAKNYAKVPMLVKIKNDKGLKRAFELIDEVIDSFAIVADPKATEQDFVASHPYDTTKNLVKRGLIKILLPDTTLSEPKPHHANEKTVEVVNNDVVEEIVIFNADKVEQAAIESIAVEPTPELEKIDYVDDTPAEEAPFVETQDQPGVEVIGVVWPERPERNKIYRYDPDGEQAAVGDVVIVPTRDASSNKDVIRKAAVAHANHKVPESDLKHPLKKIVGVIRKKLYQDDAKK